MRWHSRIALGVLVALTSAGPVHAQTVRGKITDSLSKAPLSRFVVTLLDSVDIPASRATYTDSIGLFTVVAPRPGTYTIQIRRLGYVAKSGDSFFIPSAKDTVIQNFVTMTTAQQLEAMVTKSTSVTDLQHVEFLARQRAGFGKIMDRDRILSEGWATVKDALTQGAPGLMVVKAGNGVPGQFGLYAGIEWRNCTSFAILRNGVLTASSATPDPMRRDNASLGGASRDGKGAPVNTYYTPTDTSELNHILTFSADWTYGIEIYAGQTEIPQEYRSASRGYCGVIAYWTRPP